MGKGNGLLWIKSCSEPFAAMFLSLFLFLSFSHISNGNAERRFTAWGGDDTGEGGAVFHI